MQQQKGKKPEMIIYNGRNIPKHLFCTNAYYVDDDKQVQKKLAKSFDEFKKLLISGQYFETRQQAQDSIKQKPGVKKQKE